MTPPNIFTIEDHNEAYGIWRKNCLKDKTLIHIDAHIDFATFPHNNPLCLLESRSLQELNTLVKSTESFNPSPNPKDTKPNMGNYIYPAIKEGMVKKFYWVVPDDFLNTEKKLRFWKRQISQIVKNLSPSYTPIISNNKFITARFYDTEVTICALENLPQISDYVLLDIDVDFLLTDFQSRYSPILLHMKKRLPWMWPDELAGILKGKKIKSDVITIAYSVKGYFTPLEFKYLGDELKIFLNDNNLDADTMRFIEYRKKAVISKYSGRLDEAKQYMDEAVKIFPQEPSIYYNLAQLQYQKGKFDEAKQFYQKTISLDGSYRTRYNNLGEIFNQLGLGNPMEHEYKKLLILDPDSSCAHSGMGEVLFIKNRVKDARREFERALFLEPQNNRAKFMLSVICVKERRYQEAILTLKAIIDNEIGYADAYLALGRLHTKQGPIDEAIRNFNLCIRLGVHSAGLYVNLAVLYMKKRAFFKAIKLFIKAIRLLPLEIKEFFISYFERLKIRFSG